MSSRIEGLSGEKKYGCPVCGKILNHYQMDTLSATQHRLVCDMGCGWQSTEVVPFRVVPLALDDDGCVVVKEPEPELKAPTKTARRKLTQKERLRRGLNGTEDKPPVKGKAKAKG